MRALGVVLMMLLTGCSYTRVDYSAATTISGGTAISTSSGGLHVQGGRPLAAVILGSLLLATTVDGEPPAMSLDWTGTRPVPAMQPDRTINEQDCTKPIDLSGNLRCR